MITGRGLQMRVARMRLTAAWSWARPAAFHALADCPARFAEKHVYLPSIDATAAAAYGTPPGPQYP